MKKKRFHIKRSAELEQPRKTKIFLIIVYDFYYHYDECLCGADFDKAFMDDE